jgi:hypothetical protein
MENNEIGRFWVHLLVDQYISSRRKIEIKRGYIFVKLHQKYDEALNSLILIYPKMYNCMSFIHDING